MKKLGLFLLVVLFSFSSSGDCPVWTMKGQCQMAKGLFENGEVVFKSSYCKGEFPYCESFSGNCCSDPSYDLGGWQCCDRNVYKAHEVADITPGDGGGIQKKGYKCCSIASYGKNSTYYIDREEHVHCCGGKVYRPKSGADKTCCNHEFYENGDVKHYHTVASVLGAPSDEVNQLCCRTLGNSPGEKRATAYWNGSSAQCCAGTAYKFGVDDNRKEVYSCCSGTRGTKEEKTHKVVENVVGAPNGEGACCEIEKYGENPTAYWTGTSAQCCKGEAKARLDGSGYECCPVADSCPDGSTPVTNYKDNVGACGKVCCEVKADIYNDLSDGDGPAFSKQLDYEVAGAVNGSCCGGYTKGEYERKWYIIDWGKSDPASGKFVYDGEELVESGSSSSKALILDNKGYYCGSDGSDETNYHLDGYSITLTIKHVTSSLCLQGDGSSFICSSADKGDPCRDYSNSWECTAEWKEKF